MTAAPQSQPLFEWRLTCPRWYGTPEDVAIAARKIEGEARAMFMPNTVRVRPDFYWHTVEPIPGEGEFQRVGTSSTVEALGIDLDVNRRYLRAAHVHVVVTDRSWRLPVDIENWPTKPYSQPTGVAVESPAPPLLVSLDLTPEHGAELRVLSATGLNGDMLFMAVRPYVTRGAGKLPHEAFYRGPITWLLPRFEVVGGPRRWLRIAAVAGSVIGAVGGIAGVAALIIA